MCSNPIIGISHISLNEYGIQLLNLLKMEHWSVAQDFHYSQV